MDIMERVRIRHIESILGRHLFAILRGEPYESSTTLEDYSSNLPSGALVFQPLRARVYMILQKSCRGNCMFIGREKMGDKDVNFIITVVLILHTICIVIWYLCIELWIIYIQISVTTNRYARNRECFFLEGFVLKKKTLKYKIQIQTSLYLLFQIFIYDFHISNEMYLVIIVGILGSTKVIAS